MREIISVLFPCIVILYLIECVKYVPQYHYLFFSYFGIRFNIKGSGFHFVNLSPIGTIVASGNVPVCFTRNGVYILKSKDSYEIELCEAEDFFFIPYDEMDAIEGDRNTVRINRANAIKTSSPIATRNIVGLVKELKDLDPSRRYKRIKSSLSEAFDFNATKELKSSHINLFFYLRCLSGFLFINTFVMLPLVLYSHLYFYLNIQVIVAYIILSYIASLTFAYFGHRKIYKAEKRQRLLTLFSLVFSPVSTMHVISYLTRDIYANYNYLAVATAPIAP